MALLSPLRLQFFMRLTQWIKIFLSKTYKIIRCVCGTTFPSCSFDNNFIIESIYDYVRISKAVSNLALYLTSTSAKGIFYRILL